MAEASHEDVWIVLGSGSEWDPPRDGAEVQRR